MKQPKKPTTEKELKSSIAYVKRMLKEGEELITLRQENRYLIEKNKQLLNESIRTEKMYLELNKLKKDNQELYEKYSNLSISFNQAMARQKEIRKIIGE